MGSARRAKSERITHGSSGDAAKRPYTRDGRASAVHRWRTGVVAGGALVLLVSASWGLGQLLSPDTEIVEVWIGRAGDAESRRVANLTEDDLNRMPHEVAEAFRTAATNGDHRFAITRSSWNAATSVLAAAALEQDATDGFYRYRDQILVPAVTAADPS